jgi:hypothetical protein
MSCFSEIKKKTSLSQNLSLRFLDVGGRDLEIEVSQDNVNVL